MHRALPRNPATSSGSETPNHLGPAEATLSVLWVLTPLAATISVVVVIVAMLTNQWLHTEEKMNNPSYNGTGEKDYLSKMTISGLWMFCFTNHTGSLQKYWLSPLILCVHKITNCQRKIEVPRQVQHMFIPDKMAEEIRKITPQTKKIKFDHQLKYEDFNLKLTDMKRAKLTGEQLKTNQQLNTSKAMNINQSNNDILNTNPFPEPKTLAKFSHEAYSDKIKNIPAGWQLLTVGENKKTQYFGAAFCNITNRQVVIAHRGTLITNLKHLKTDFIAVFCNKYDSLMNSALTFTEVVMRNVKLQVGNKVHYSFTGHSLGGWLAQLSGFYSEYLVRDGDYFAKNTQDRGVHAHVVAFEPPGCKNMLEKMKLDYDFRYSIGQSMSLDNLDITSYLSAPNKINGCNVHVGVLYRIFPHVGRSYRFLDTYDTYTHKMKNILELFDEKIDCRIDNIVTDNRVIDNVVMLRVVDWPIWSILGSEHANFFKWANDLNDYHPCNFKSKYFCEGNQRSLRYQTQALDPNSCPLRVFNREEVDVLKMLNHCNQQKVNVVAWNKLKTFFREELGLSEQLTENILKVFGRFKIEEENGRVVCNSKEDLQNLFRWFKQLMLVLIIEEAMRDFFQVIEGVVPKKVVLEIILSQFKSALVESELDFDVSAELERFLIDSPGFSTLNVISTENLEWVRLNNILRKSGKNIQESAPILLKRDAIKSIQKYVNFSDIFSSESHWFIAEYSDGLFDLQETIEKVQISEKKLIVLTHSEVRFNIPKLKTEKITFSNLTLDSKNKVLNNAIITFGDNNQKSFKECFDFESPNVQRFLDSLPIEKLLDNPYLNVRVANENRYYNRDVMYNKVNLELSVEKVAKFFLEEYEKARVALGKPLLFFASGFDFGNERDRIAFLHAFKVKTEEDKMSLSNYLGKIIFSYSSFRDFCQTKFDSVIFSMKVKDDFVMFSDLFDRNFYVERKVCLPFVKDVHELLSEGVVVFHNLNSKEEVLSWLKVEENSNMGKNIRVSDRKISRSCKRENEYVVSYQPISEVDFFILEDSLSSSKVTYGSVDESKFVKCSNGTFMLSDEPGMGKTTTLDSLSMRIADSFVIRINLKHIKNLEFELTVKNIAKFLLENNIDNKIESSQKGNEIENQLLQNCLHHKDFIPLYLLFDGFDEIISGKDLQKITSLFQFLNTKTEAHVWITTRQYCSDLLTNNLLVFRIHFQRITTEEQIEFLTRLWSPAIVLELGGNFNKQILINYISNMITKARAALSSDISNLMGVPLQMQMIGDLLRPPAELFLHEEENYDFYFPSVLELYRKFIERKYDIYFREKLEYPERLGAQKRMLMGKLRKTHRKLSVLFLLAEDKSKLTDGRGKKGETFEGENTQFETTEEENTERGNNYKENTLDITTKEKHFVSFEDKCEMNRVGLAQINTVDGSIDFIHRTIAEYFLADLLVHSIKQKRPAFVEIMFSEVLRSRNLKLVRYFINLILREDRLPQDSIECFAKTTTELWYEKADIFFVNREYFFEQQVESVLQFTVNENNEAIIALLLMGLTFASTSKKYCNFVCASNQFGATALTLAIEKKYNLVIDTFLNCLAKCSKYVIENVLYSALFFYNDNTIKKLLTSYLKDVQNTFKNETILKCVEKIDLKYKTDLDLRDFLNQLKTLDINIRRIFIRKIINKDETYLHKALKGGELALFKDIIKTICVYEADPETSLTISNLTEVNEFTESANTESNNLEPTTITYRYKQSELVVDNICIPDLNIFDGNMQTLLYLACESEDYDTIKYLIKLGANLNLSDKFGRTPIMRSVSKGRCKLANYLRKKGARIDGFDIINRNILHFAARGGCREFVEGLLNENVFSINSEDMMGMTPVMHSAVMGHDELAMCLVVRKTELKNRGQDGKTLLHFAAKGGCICLTKTIIDGSVCDVNAEDDDGRTPIMYSHYRKHLEITEYLLSKGAREADLLKRVNLEGDDDDF